MTTWISSTLPDVNASGDCLGSDRSVTSRLRRNGAEWAGTQEGGPRRMQVGRGKRILTLLSRAFRTAGIVLE